MYEPAKRKRKEREVSKNPPRDFLRRSAPSEKLAMYKIQEKEKSTEI